MGNQAQPARTPIGDDISTEDLLTRYLAGPALVRISIVGMDESQLHARPIPDKMSTHSVVAHIVDSERGLGGRLKRAIAGDEPAPSQGGHPEIEIDPERDLDVELEWLDTARTQMAEELRQLPPAVWERTALRLRDRELTMRQGLMFMTRHLESHVAAIEEKRVALGL